MTHGSRINTDRGKDVTELKTVARSSLTPGHCVHVTLRVGEKTFFMNVT